jgi:hypothetical protein
MWEPRGDRLNDDARTALMPAWAGVFQPEDRRACGAKGPPLPLQMITSRHTGISGELPRTALSGVGDPAERLSPTRLRAKL